MFQKTEMQYFSKLKEIKAMLLWEIMLATPQRKKLLKYV